MQIDPSCHLGAFWRPTNPIIVDPNSDFIPVRWMVVRDGRLLIQLSTFHKVRPVTGNAADGVT